MEEAINKAPSTSGVYFFLKNNDIVYIGKSVNIRARLRSHIENAKTDRKELLITQKSNRVGYIVTDSEFRAILLESDLIRKYKPKYNVRWKDDKSNLYIKITKSDDFPKILLTRKTEVNDRRSLYFGPFSSARTAERVVREIRKVVPFCSQKKITRNACFYNKIRLCNPCPNVIARLPDGEEKRNLRRRYHQNVRNIISLLSDKQDTLLSRFYQEMQALKKQKKYEEALIIRDKALQLEYLLQRKSFSNFHDELPVQFNAKKLHKELHDFIKIYFPKLGNISRIECYDISNLQFREGTGSMVVYQNGGLDRSLYRRFRIKRATDLSDFDMMREVVERRLKNDWLKPDLILIDGGKPQLRHLLDILKGFAVIGIAKHPDRLVIGTGIMPTVRLANNSDLLNLFRAIRDESHRYAKNYHLLLRRKELI